MKVGDLLRRKKVLFGLMLIIMSIIACTFMCEAAEENYMVTSSGTKGEAFYIFDIEGEHYYIITYINKEQKVTMETVLK